MCASSITYTLNRLATGAKIARSRRSRASSTPPCEAASISITSIDPGPSGASATHESHSPHGSGVGPFSQLSERARIRALLVLPQPRGPENRYAWLNRPLRSACINGSVTCSCPMTSANVRGRYLRYSASATRTSYPSGLTEGPPVHPSEPAYPCCLPALGRFTGCTPHEGLRPLYPVVPAFAQFLGHLRPRHRDQMRLDLRAATQLLVRLQHVPLQLRPRHLREPRRQGIDLALQRGPGVDQPTCTDRLAHLRLHTTTP